jgi:hypothetical protein
MHLDGNQCEMFRGAVEQSGAAYVTDENAIVAQNGSTSIDSRSIGDAVTHLKSTACFSYVAQAFFSRQVC